MLWVFGIFVSEFPVTAQRVVGRNCARASDWLNPVRRVCGIRGRLSPQFGAGEKIRFSNSSRRPKATKKEKFFFLSFIYSLVHFFLPSTKFLVSRFVSCIGAVSVQKSQWTPIGVYDGVRVFFPFCEYYILVATPVQCCSLACWARSYQHHGYSMTVSGYAVQSMWAVNEKFWGQNREIFGVWSGGNTCGISIIRWKVSFAATGAKYTSLMLPWKVYFRCH